MARSGFPLQPALDLAVHEEEGARRAWLGGRNALAAALAASSALEAERKRMPRPLQRGVPANGAWLGLAAERRRALDAECGRAAERVAHAERALEMLRAAFERALRARRAFERLRELRGAELSRRRALRRARELDESDRRGGGPAAAAL